MYDDSVFRAANGMGAGLAYKGDVCGSLLGGCMMLGLKFGLGSEKLARSEEPHPSYPAVQEFYDWFQNEFGSTKCPDIFGGYAREFNVNNIDLDAMRTKTTRNEKEQALVDAVHKKCDQLTGRVAARIAETIWDAIEAEKRK